MPVLVSAALLTKKQGIIHPTILSVRRQPHGLVPALLVTVSQSLVELSGIRSEISMIPIAYDLDAMRTKLDTIAEPVAGVTDAHLLLSMVSWAKGTIMTVSLFVTGTGRSPSAKTVCMALDPARQKEWYICRTLAEVV